MLLAADAAASAVLLIRLLLLLLPLQLLLLLLPPPLLLLPLLSIARSRHLAGALGIMKQACAHSPRKLLLANAQIQKHEWPKHTSTPSSP